MRNALTVDVEDYFHVSAFDSCVRPADWESMPSRVQGNTLRVLELFEELSVRGTFFMLGWVAERHPWLVRRIADAGHEIGCHGYAHRRITAQSPDVFRQDVQRAKSYLEDVGGKPVVGFRAPSWTITRSTLWALDILQQLGFTYDSSIFPIHHDIYGMPGAERFPHVMQCGQGLLAEFPPSTVVFSAGRRSFNFPVAGGGYLRLLPAPLIGRAYAALNSRNHPAVLYFHPWEIDPAQPRIPGRVPLRSRFRHYLNLGRMERKLRYLLTHHSFAPMAQVLEDALGAGTMQTVSAPQGSFSGENAHV
ncbi:XrtA system polysaccharide deacetylase [Oleidesulfovibrio alaskensis]|uniref:XrtA system polysaccharide deacetylase n=1 Tax=Oleidesulfovibrio alaskensis TaxID=58180 RepID=UPI00041EFB6B|nr:XrtA system polysaccharide deacetylase [Oleidesulfovibrio alaskensis]